MFVWYYLLPNAYMVARSHSHQVAESREQRAEGRGHGAWGMFAGRLCRSKAEAFFVLRNEMQEEAKVGGMEGRAVKDER